jgi:urease accessory protein
MPHLKLGARLSGPTAILLASLTPAFAHHVMGGATPVTFGQGLLSGLAHPVIGFDHLAVVIAVGCLAAAHRAGVGLIAGFVLAMMIGVATHVRGINVVASETLLAAVVIALGAAILFRHAIGTALMIALFTFAGLLSGYALGESITGAERGPLSAYFVGLAIVQLVLALVVVWLARRFALQPDATLNANVRIVGAIVIGVGLIGLVAHGVLGV